MGGTTRLCRRKMNCLDYMLESGMRPTKIYMMLSTRQCLLCNAEAEDLLLLCVSLSWKGEACPRYAVTGSSWNPAEAVLVVLALLLCVPASQLSRISKEPVCRGKKKPPYVIVCLGPALRSCRLNYEMQCNTSYLTWVLWHTPLDKAHGPGQHIKDWDGKVGCACRDNLVEEFLVTRLVMSRSQFGDHCLS
ncbi:hypothetical protein F5Y17DRAFT_260112 [Xylariaceae sp. FL0594]|nr:hypothetical protein F5Y17DRAFT_260112 [Xylariaceae sp. FL0594]